jgi:hypothetical protein
MAMQLHPASARLAILAAAVLLGVVFSEARSTIVNITTAVDGNKLTLSTIELTSGTGNPNRLFTYDQLIKPSVVDYLSVPENNAANTVTVMGTPDTTAPDGQARLALISDAALNTGIFNPSATMPGLVLTFPQPLINGPGEDLVLFELAIGTGQTPDPVAIWKADGTGTPRNVTSGQYQKSDLIPVDGTPVPYAVTVGEGLSATYNDLLNLPVTPGAATNPKWHAVPINLNALGLAEGDSVQSLAILSGDATRAVDLLLVAGLLPYVATIPGDYNGDQTVNAADYIVWCKMAGQSGMGLGADGSGPSGTPDGVVDDYDYDFWTANFGNTLSGAGSSAGVDGIVPEPATCFLAVVASLVWTVIGRTRHAEYTFLAWAFGDVSDA